MHEEIKEIKLEAGYKLTKYKNTNATWLIDNNKNNLFIHATKITLDADKETWLKLFDGGKYIASIWVNKAITIRRIKRLMKLEA